MNSLQKPKSTRLMTYFRHLQRASALSLLLFHSPFSHAASVDSGAIALGSGKASSAKFSIGTLVDNGAYTGTAFESSQKFSFLCKLDVPAEQVGKDAKIYLVAKYQGNSYMATPDNTWIPWDGNPSSLVANIEKLTLKTTQQDFIHTSFTGVKGDFQLYIGYSVDNVIYHNNTPLSFNVAAAPNNPPLTHAELMMVQPSPDIRPTYDANKTYVSGGIGILVYTCNTQK